MTDKQLADVICRALLAIVAAIRKRYDLPTYKGMTVEIHESDSLAGVSDYDSINYQKHKQYKRLSIVCQASLLLKPLHKSVRTL